MFNSSSTHHTFCVELVTQYGLEEAILIHHFQHWIKYNRRLKRNFKDGHWWTYQTREEIAAHFPYWSPEKVRRYIESLIRQNVLVAGNFNKTSFDKTLWYAFVDEEKFITDDGFSNNSYERQICQIDRSDPPNRLGQNARPIPHTNTNTKKDKKEREGEEPPPTPATPIESKEKEFSHKRVEMKLSDHAALISDFGAEKTAEMIDRLDEYADINPKRFRQYANHSTVIRNWIRNDKSKPNTQGTSLNASNFVQKVKSIPGVVSRPDIVFGRDYIEFSRIRDAYFKFGEAAFEEKVKNTLRKMGIPVHTLE